MTRARAVAMTLTGAVIGLLVMVADVAIEAPSPPVISVGVPVLPQCPPSTSEEYFYPRGTLVPRNEQIDTAVRAHFSSLLATAGAAPLWCGDRRDVAYRFMLVFEWGTTKVISVRRSGVTWMLDAAEFQHTAVARLGINRRVTRALSPAEVETVTSALDKDRLWRLPSQEPLRGCCYDGPHWFLEGRSAGGYHAVSRAWDREEITGTGRALMRLAGMSGEENTAPPRPTSLPSPTHPPTPGAADWRPAGRSVRCTTSQPCLRD